MTDEELSAMRATVGASTGLTPAQAARLRGETQAEMEADAANLLRLFAPPMPRSGSGSDVGGNAGPVESGAARYRAEHGIGEDGQPLPADGRMPRSKWAA